VIRLIYYLIAVIAIEISKSCRVYHVAILKDARTLSAKCPTGQSLSPADCGRLLWTAPKGGA